MRTNGHSLGARRTRRWFYAWAGTLFGVPLLYWAVGFALAKSGVRVEGPFFQLFEDLMSWTFYLPAKCFGPAHFCDSVAFYAPLDVAGLILLVGFYLFIALFLAVVSSLVQSQISKRRSQRTTPPTVFSSRADAG